MASLPRKELHNIPASEIERLVTDLEQAGARDIKKTLQGDGHYALSFLPGDPDFPAEDAPKQLETFLPEESPDFPTEDDEPKQDK